MIKKIVSQKASIRASERPQKTSKRPRHYGVGFLYPKLLKNYLLVWMKKSLSKTSNGNAMWIVRDD